MINQAQAADKLIDITSSAKAIVQTTNTAMLEQVIPYTNFLLDDKKLEKLKEKMNYKHGLFDRDARESVEGTRIQVMAEMDSWALKVTQRPHILLITGLPGSGKSTLTDMWTNSRQKENNFIFGARICFNRQRDVTTRAVFSSIAIQLLEKTNSKEALEAIDSRVKGSEVQAWDLPWYIKEIFITPANIIAKQFQSKALIVVIDALDECSDKEILDALEILSKRLPLNFKLLITSRANANMQNYFQERIDNLALKTFDLNEVKEVNKDIEIFIRDRIKTQSKEINNSLNDQDISTLSKVADGLFLYAKTIIG